MTAHNTNDASTIADQFQADAALYDPALPASYEEFRSNEGRSAIQRFYGWINEMNRGGYTVERISPVFQSGDLVTFMVEDLNGLDHLLVQIWRDGKILTQWIVMPKGP